jgi:VIT1/CCC1 family predicted Fe2+/Mn2+ transporter
MNYLKKFHADNWHAAENRAARHVVYAFDAGLLTTIAFLAGVTASNLNCKTIMLSGLASITSCTLTVFFLAYISTKSRVDFFEGQIERKEREFAGSTFDNPAKTGFLAAMFYLSGAFVLMMPFIIFDNPTAALKIAGGLVLLFLFIAGILKALLTKQKWVFSALEMILVGVVSCAIGFAFGSFAAKLFAKIIG